MHDTDLHHIFIKDRNSLKIEWSKGLKGTSTWMLMFKKTICPTWHISMLLMYKKTLLSRPLFLSFFLILFSIFSQSASRQHVERILIAIALYSKDIEITKHVALIFYPPQKEKEKRCCYEHIHTRNKRIKKNKKINLLTVGNVHDIIQFSNWGKNDYNSYRRTLWAALFAKILYKLRRVSWFNWSTCLRIGVAHASLKFWASE